MTITQSLIAFTAAATVLTLTPGVDTAMVLRSAATGPRNAVFASIGIGLGYLGSQEPTEGLALIARILTFGYFAFFLIIMPILSFTERTKPIPTSIADAVRAMTKTAAAAAAE